MRAGAERAPGIDHDGSHSGLRFLPRRPDPERAHDGGNVEGAPTLVPAGLDLRRAHGGKTAAEPAFLLLVAVARELYDIAEFDLLESLGEDFEDEGARRLGVSRRDGHGEAAKGQRNALLSFSSRRRCSGVTWRGTRTSTSTRWSPRPRPWRTGIPRPGKTMTAPGWVPEAT